MTNEIVRYIYIYMYISWLKKQKDKELLDRKPELELWFPAHEENHTGRPDHID